MNLQGPRNSSADGLRGFGAMVVVISHYFSAFFPAVMHGYYPAEFSAPTHTSALFSFLKLPGVNLFYNGHFAVIVFFLLSGFVLSEPHFRGDNSAIQRRLLGRYLRLNLPVAFICILSSMLLAMHFYFNREAAATIGNVWFGARFNHPVDLLETARIASYGVVLFGNSYLNIPFWTLGIEFIASISLLLFLLRERILYRVIIIGVTFAAAFFCRNESQSFGRLAAGIAIVFLGSQFHRIPLANWSVLAVLFVVGAYLGGYDAESAFYSYLPQGFGIGRNTYQVLGAIMFCFAVIKGFCFGVFASEVGKFLGYISYSLYITHFIVLSSLASYLTSQWNAGGLAFGSIFVIYLCTSIAISFLFANTIDAWAIQIAHKFAKLMMRPRDAS
jgi:peptidoglycan/LPS O-acetylase OafA/YrhL